MKVLGAGALVAYVFAISGVGPFSCIFLIIWVQNMVMMTRLKGFKPAVRVRGSFNCGSFRI